MISRRSLLSAAALPALHGASKAASGDPRPLNLAVFGFKYNAAAVLSAAHVYDLNIIALCDPDSREITAAKEKWRETAARIEKEGPAPLQPWIAKYRAMAEGKGVATYADFRRMLEEQGNAIDAVVISHYDHLHGIACGPALRAGKPVFSERPLGLNISDARKLRLLARETGLPAAYRSPGTSQGAFRRALELVEDGAIGEIREVHLWFDRGGPDRTALPQGTQPVPPGLSWDHWLGPLPVRAFHPDWMSYANWRETCSGGLGTFGPHTAILPFLALKMPLLWSKTDPIRITAECSGLNRLSFPKWERVRWEIPARGPMPPAEITWHHGPGLPPGSREILHAKLRGFGVHASSEADALMKNAGSLLVGSAGAIVGDDHSVSVAYLPAGKFEKADIASPRRIPPGRNIYHDWFDACRGGTSLILGNFENGGMLSEFLMLGNLATLHPGETLSYDPAAGRLFSHPEANRYLGIEYREGWRI